MSDDDKQTIAFLESAVPDLYQHNAFRVLGLPVRATPIEIDKRQKRLKLTAKLGAAVGTSETPGCLPIAKSPDEESVSKAYHRLNDRPRRLFDEFFWFWPLDAGADDNALAALASGNLNGAIENWTRSLSIAKEQSVAAHNLAVLYHVLALDTELSGDPASLDEKRRNRRDHCWVESYRHWKETIESESFWKLLSVRARELGDPRLTERTTEQMREQLPEFLATIAVTLAIQAVAGAAHAEVARHLLYMRKGGWDLSLARKIAEQRVAPYLEQIKNRCDSAESFSKNNPAEGKVAAQRCLEDTKPLMHYFDYLFQPEYHLSRAAHDRVAGTVRTCVIAFGNATSDWTACRSLVQRARRLAVDPLLQEKLDNDLAEVEAIEWLNKISAICNELIASTEGSPAQGMHFAEACLKRVQPYLSSIEQALPSENQLRQDANDMIAGALRNCMVEFGNRTEKWDGCLSYLKKAQALAYDGPLQVQLKEDIEDVEQRLGRAREQERLKSLIKCDKVFDVSVDKELIKYASKCICCLGPPNSEQTVSYTRSTGQSQRTLSLGLPICSECLRHQSEYYAKRNVLWISAIALSSLCVLFFNMQISGWPWWASLVLGAVACVASVWILSRCISLTALGEVHACRTAPVEIADLAGAAVTFRFHNPVYAEAFAEANDSAVYQRNHAKPPRGTSLIERSNSVDFYGIAVVISAIAHALICASFSEDSSSPKAAKPETNKIVSPGGSANPSPARTPSDWSRRPSTHTYSPSSLIPSAPASRSSFNSGLSSRIDAGKVLADKLESELGLLDSRLEFIQGQITMSEELIRDYERKIRLDLNVDMASYKQAVADHNSLVAQHNAILSERKTKYAEYSRQIDTVNEMVGRYNRGER